MKQRKFLVVLTLLSTVILLGAAKMEKPDEKQEKFKNLKVLPKKISNDDLRKVMRGWNNALGVKCNFCHVQSPDDPKKLDFASDAKPEKEMARSMYKMTQKINKKYFDHKGAAVLEVDCNTCHRGKTHPEK